MTTNSTEATISFGVCPSSDEPRCGRSYALGAAIPDDRMAWYSINHLPGGGHPGPLEVGLLDRCRKTYQVHSEKCGYCDVSGRLLVFNPEFPDLGQCKCGRKYNEADFDKQFCPECGEPVSIDDAIKAEHAKQSRISILLKEVPLLQRDGYLPSRIGLKT